MTGFAVIDLETTGFAHNHMRHASNLRRSGPERADRHHVDAVRSSVRRARAGDDGQHGGVFVSVGVDVRGKAQQPCRCRVDRVCARPELHFKAGPPAGGELDDRVDLAARGVARVEHFAAERLRKHAQIVHHERLEQLASEAQIAAECRGFTSDEGERQ